MKNKRPYLITIIVLIIGFIAYKVIQLYKWYNTLGVLPKISFKKIEKNNLILDLKIVLDNPKGFSLSVTRPNIRLYLNGSLLTSSDYSSKKVKILPFAKTEIHYEISIPITTTLIKEIATAGVTTVDQLRAGSSELKLGLNLETHAHFEVWGIPNTYVEKINV